MTTSEPTLGVTTPTAPARPDAGRFIGIAGDAPPGSPWGCQVTTSAAGAAPAQALARAASRGRETSPWWTSGPRGGGPATWTDW